MYYDQEEGRRKEEDKEIKEGKNIKYAIEYSFLGITPSGLRTRAITLAAINRINTPVWILVPLINLVKIALSGKNGVPL